MVPDRGCGVDLFDEFVVVSVGVEAVFISAAHDDKIHRFSDGSVSQSMLDR